MPDFSKLPLDATSVEALKSLILPSAKGPTSEAIVNRLQHQTIQSEPYSFQEIQDLLATEQSNQPFSSLTRLGKFVHSACIGNSDNIKELATLRPTQQITAQVRQQTHEFMSDVCRSAVLKLMHQLEQGHLLIAEAEMGPIQTVAQFQQTEIEGKLFYVCPLDSKLKKTVGAKTIYDTTLALKQMFTRSLSEMVKNVVQELADDPRYKVAVEVRDLIKASPPGSCPVTRLLSSGFGTAFSVTFAAPVALISTIQKEHPGLLRTLSPEQLMRGVEHQKHFVMKLATWSLSPMLALLNEVSDLSHPSTARFFSTRFFGWAPEEHVQVFQEMVKRTQEMNPQYFRIVWERPLNSAQKETDIPTLDLNFKGFSVPQVQRLCNPDIRPGCPALPMLGEFIPRLLSIFNQTVTSQLWD